MIEKLSIDDQLLAAAVQALRQVAPAAELPPEVLARITAIGGTPDVKDASVSPLPKAGRKSRIGPLSKEFSVSLARRVAALLVIGGLVGLVVFLRTGATLAFADVARHLRDAHTLSFQMTVQSPQIPKLVAGKTGNLDLQVFLKEPGRFRVAGPFGLIGIASLGPDQSKLVVLHSFTRVAVQVAAKGNLQELGYSDPMEWVQALRALAGKSAQQAGQRRIGEIEAQGFLIKEDAEETLVWADPKTRLPVLIEGTSPDGTQYTLGDFRFNPQLDESLFSLEVPEEYKLVPVDVDVLTPEESLLRTLRSHAEASAGRFPKDLEDVMPADMQDTLNYICALMFVDSLKGDYGYSPEGAKLGVADKILFWYRPARATKIRVLYGDLHWADLGADVGANLPPGKRVREQPQNVRPVAD